MYSRAPEEARHWALAVVEEAVTGKVENDVYPTLLGDPGSYKPAWGFKSLLGAMWFQMRSFMLGESYICPRCGRAFSKTRRDKTYCSDRCATRARSHRNYNADDGRRSSKQARQDKRRRP